MRGDQLLQKYRIDDFEECKALCLARLECKMFIFQSGVNIRYTPCSLYKTFQNWVTYYKLLIINNITCYFIFNLTFTHPLGRKLRMRWFFDVSNVKESSFFLNQTWLTPLSTIFDAHLVENTNSSPSSFHFSVYFKWRSCFEYCKIVL